MKRGRALRGSVRCGPPRTTPNWHGNWTGCSNLDQQGGAVMLKFLGTTMGIIFLIGLLVVIGLIALIL